MVFQIPEVFRLHRGGCLQLIAGEFNAGVVLTVVQRKCELILAVSILRNGVLHLRAVHTFEDKHAVVSGIGIRIGNAVSVEFEICRNLRCHIGVELVIGNGCLVVRSDVDAEYRVVLDTYR